MNDDPAHAGAHLRIFQVIQVMLEILKYLNALDQRFFVVRKLAHDFCNVIHPSACLRGCDPL